MTDTTVRVSNDARTSYEINIRDLELVGLVTVPTHVDLRLVFKFPRSKVRMSRVRRLNPSIDPIRPL